MHVEIEPAILYFGTPTVLISTLNDDGSTNIAPNSSVWWLGWSCMIGLDASSQTTYNLQKRGQCVLNLASIDNIDAINKLARTTGRSKVPVHKKMLGYSSSQDKFRQADLTSLQAKSVLPDRVKECPVHLEGEVAELHSFAEDDERMGVPAKAFEIRIKHVHVEETLLKGKSRVDPNKWNPLIMSFRELYGLSHQLDRSRLASGPEALYAPWKFPLVRRFFSKRQASSGK